MLSFFSARGALLFLCTAIASGDSIVPHMSPRGSLIREVLINGTKLRDMSEVCSWIIRVRTSLDYPSPWSKVSRIRPS